MMATEFCPICVTHIIKEYFKQALLNFARRSYEKELLDRDDIPFEDIKLNMKELDFINRHLGGHQITLNGFRKTIGKSRHAKIENGKIISVCEIGCGGGDNLRVLKKYCEAKKISAEFLGIDINPHCIEFARSRKENRDIVFLASDYNLVQFSRQPDIIFCSLFCHHFTNEGVVEVLTWMRKNARAGFFINDLHRHPLAYYSIKFLTRYFSKSYLVKNDACLSVLRGFKRNEWKMLMHKSSITGTQLKWKWAFRWLLICSNEGTSGI